MVLPEVSPTHTGPGQPQQQGYWSHSGWGRGSRTGPGQSSGFGKLQGLNMPTPGIAMSLWAWPGGSCHLVTRAEMISVMVALTSASISSTGPGMGSCWQRCSALRICCRFCQMISASFSHLQGARGLQRDAGCCSSPGQGRKMHDPLPPSQQSTSPDPRRVPALATTTLHRHRATKILCFPKAQDGQGGPNLEPTRSRVALPIPRHHCPLGEVAQV